MEDSLVLLPTYNERETLPLIVPRLSLIDDPVDVLVIDDASPDGTGDVAEELRLEYPRLSVLHRRRKDGLGRAYVHGFAEAIRRGYDRIVTMDADLSHAPEDVPRLLRALDDADVAVGSRHAPGGGVEGWPLSRKALSRFGSLYARMLLQIPVSDVTGGFRAYRTETLKELDFGLLHATGFVFQVEILRRILDLPGTCAFEVPIVFRDRALGSSKMTWDIVAEGVREVGRLVFRDRVFPLRGRAPLRAPRPHEPIVTVVIPVREGAAGPAALEGLESIHYAARNLELMVVRGSAPSRQRNQAVARGRGELLLFLDDDSAPDADLVSIYVSAFERDSTLGAVGGPAVTSSVTPFQELAGLVLEDAWVVGRAASRYRSRGKPRFTDERELILCNLCIKRSAFEAVGGFNETLYPNEENELLERMRRRGSRLLYRPDARVRRPPRESLGEFLASICRYGVGRGRQIRCLPTRTSIGRIALTVLAMLGVSASLAAVAGGAPALLAPAAFYLAFLVALSIRLSLRAGISKGILAALLCALLHGSYALGLLGGLLFPPRRVEPGAVSVERHLVQRNAGGKVMS